MLTYCSNFSFDINRSNYSDCFEPDSRLVNHHRITTPTRPYFVRLQLTSKDRLIDEVYRCFESDDFKYSSECDLLISDLFCDLIRFHHLLNFLFYLDDAILHVQRSQLIQPQLSIRKHLIELNTPIPQAVLRPVDECLFVEQEIDVMLFQIFRFQLMNQVWSKCKQSTLGQKSIYFVRC